MRVNDGSKVLVTQNMTQFLTRHNDVTGDKAETSIISWLMKGFFS
jgi:hypothetical protein